MDQKTIRNFAIIAHIDHGKSTLADRMLEITGTVSKRDLVAQTLDSHPISRERGITIKLAPVTMKYSVPSPSPLTATPYILNLIDTPGHVDFSYEVERSLAACEGAILLVDATQGVQAQTLSNFQKAQKLGLKIIPVINKVDMPNALVEQTEKEIIELVSQIRHSGESASGVTTPESLNNTLRDPGQARMTPLIHRISAKTGLGVPELLQAVVENVPPPQGNENNPTRALVFSSQFDPHRGVIAFVRIVDGKISKGDKLKFLATQTESEALEIGHFVPSMSESDGLETGEVGYVITTLKDIAHVQAGDTITTVIPDEAKRRSGIYINKPLDSGTEAGMTSVSALPGYNPPNPMVFVSLFPVDQDEFKELEDGLNKLKLNDAALIFTRTESKALGRGFRVGFLGHLHAEVTQERLQSEFGLSIISTTPTVEFHNQTVSSRAQSRDLPRKDSSTSSLSSSFAQNDKWEEPWVQATIIVPQDYVGAVITLCEDRRGKLIDMQYQGTHVNLHYELPLTEIITDFFDQLKSKTSGYGSLDYSVLDYRPFDCVELKILINHQEVDALSQLVEKTKAQFIASRLVEKLKEAIPRQQIPIPIQASINGQIVARADISAFRKDVTAKLYGGDVTRRNKLLEKQKKGKEKMKQIGSVTIPNDTFLKVFKT